MRAFVDVSALAGGIYDTKDVLNGVVCREYFLEVKDARKDSYSAFLR